MSVLATGASFGYTDAAFTRYVTEALLADLAELGVRDARVFIGRSSHDNATFFDVTFEGGRVLQSVTDMHVTGAADPGEAIGKWIKATVDAVKAKLDAAT